VPARRNGKAPIEVRCAVARHARRREQFIHQHAAAKLDLHRHAVPAARAVLRRAHVRCARGKFLRRDPAAGLETLARVHHDHAHERLSLA